jgi:hypothetical protein
MDGQPRFSDEELTLVVELLQREHDDLPTEIHHCRVASYRDELRHRQQIVKDLLHRLQTVGATTAEYPQEQPFRMGR